MRLLRFIAIAALLLVAAANAEAQSFSVSPNTIPITAVPGMNHLPMQVPVTYSPANYDWTKISVSSDSSWVTASIDATTGNLALSFTTSDLVKRTYTATLTLSDGPRSAQAFVQATVSPLSVTRIVADPTRSRVYAVQQDALNAGSVLVYDPLNAKYVGEITVGKKPCDLAISKDGLEMLVICSVSQSISVIDLTKLMVRETFGVAPYAEWSQADTSAHVGYGPGNTIYYTDGAWAPVLHVFDRATKTSVQNVTIDPTSGNGWGGFVLSPDQKSVFGWAQYGWSAGWTGCYLSKYKVGSDGKLTFDSSTSGNPSGLTRDPLNTPAMMAADGNTLLVKQLAVSPSQISNVLQTIPAPAFAISPNAEVLSTDSAIYSRDTGNKVYDLPVKTQVQAITWDYSRLVYFDSTAKALATVDLTKALSLSTLGLNRAPADQAIVLAPTQLQWSPVPGVSKYQVYLGTSSAAVAAATTASPEYLGVATGASYALTVSLSAGKTYYWRVDSVGANGVAAGPVASFTVSSVACDTSSISAATVQVQKAYPISIGLSSGGSGKAWKATADAAWISFASSSGTTPATLQAYLDATQLKSGTSQATISITTDEGTFSIPVKLVVDPLALTVVRSDPQSTKVYAISEVSATSGSGTTTATPRAYLLEIDALLQQVTRVVPVGTSATDLAIHHGDNRIYVPNWRPGGLLAVNLTTFKVERTYATSPFGGTGYSAGDVYRVSAGVAGRLVAEEEDQWIDIRILDTATGNWVGKTSTREGGGQCDPTGRYYYHGDNNISDASMHKLDMLGDKMTEVAQTEAVSVGYYGSRNVVVSEDGSHIYWNGVAFAPDLKVLAKLGEEIYATTADGRYAFSQTKAYDVGTMDVTATMPASLGTAFAYNTATGRIVGQTGANLIFYAPLGGTVLGSGLTPKDGAIVSSASQLTWTTLPGVDSYRVFLGTSAAAVAQATTSSAEYIGTVSGGSIAMPSSATPGKTYYWRVDLMAGGAVVSTQTQKFTLSAVVPSLSAIDAVAVQGYAVPVSVQLTSPVANAWTATAADAWVVLGGTTGTTPGTLSATLDASKLPAGASTSSITITGAWGTLTVPVTLRVDALTLTVLRSDPQSSKVYAINEPKVTTGPSRAFLLEIDSATEKILRSVQVGSSATDLAIHRADNRVYVTNWQPGGVVGVNLTSFTVDRTLATPAYGSYGEDDAYRIAGVVAGRLVTEAEDQWININLYDTATGTKLATTFQREGGGQFDPTGRYYYHGDNNISDAKLHKFDLLSDKFTEVAVSASSYAARSVVVTEDGSRVFWGHTMFDSDAKTLWSVGDEVYSATKDGRYAVAAAKIYDTVQHQAVFAVPAGGGAVSTVNSTTSKLVVQNGTKIGFYRLDPNATPVAPVLGSPTSVATTSVVLPWTVDGLQMGFTVQMRASGAPSWTDVTAAIAGSSNTYTVTGLTSGTSYEFRVKADGPGGSSTWSNVVSATTTTMLPSFLQQPASQVVALGSAATFSVSVNAAVGATFQWYKDGQPIAGATSSTLTIPNVSGSDAGSYAVKVTNSAGTVTSSAATLVAGNARIINFSIRSMSGSDSAVLVVGFGTVGGSKTLLLRGIGPGLSGFGVSGYLADPQLRLYNGSHLMTANDNWSAGNAAQIATVAAQVGAFSLAQGSLDSALYYSVSGGAYTMQVSGNQGATGITLAEIYDVDPATVSRLVNVSARTFVGAGDSALIGGFVVTGSGRKTVLIRAIGPGLTGFGVAGVLDDPTLEVIPTGSATAIASNNDWGGTNALSSTFSQVGAFPLDPASKDAAVVVQLSAGSYTAVVKGANGSTGIALLEVYEVQ